MKFTLLSKISNKKQEEENIDIISQLRETKKKMDCIESWFSLENDENLIESCIYEREALNARYKYLMKLARCNNVINDPFN